MTASVDSKGRVISFLRTLPGRMITSILVLAVLFGALLLSSVMYLSMQAQKQRFIEDARNHASLLAELVGANPDRSRVNNLFKNLAASGRVVYAEFVDANGAGHAPPFILAGRRNLSYLEDKSFGEHHDNVYYIAVPFQDGKGKTVGFLRLGYDERSLAEELRHIVNRSVVFALVYVWALLLTSASLALRLTNPLKLLQTASRQIASGHVDTALNVPTNVAEISSLVDDLEYMRKELVARSQKLAASEARYSTILEHAAEGIITLNQHARIEGFNKAAESLFGYQVHEILDTSFTHLLTSEDRTRFIGPDGTPIVADDLVLTGLRKNGETFHLLVSINSVTHSDRSLFILVAQDISDRIAYEEKLANLAYYDTLTGLPNRRLFYDRLQHEIACNSRRKNLLTVFFFDLDGFKVINDTFGHQTGDVLLQAVAERLRSIVRASDTIARLGGDEFTLILTDFSDVRDIDRLAQKIIKSFSQPFNLAGQEAFVSTSLGIAVAHPSDDTDVDQLIKHADTAMYFAKSGGKDNYQFYSGEMSAVTKEY